MFEVVVRDDTGELIDSRDVPPARLSLFASSQLGRYAAVLSANVEALEEDNQLELGAELASCTATLEWMKCRVASSLAVKDASSPGANSAPHLGPSLRGQPVLQQLGGPDTPAVSEFLVPEIALAFRCSDRDATCYVAIGLDLRFRLRCTNAEFGGGRITYAHAKVISEATRHLPVEAAEALDAVLADAAVTRTPARLRILARRKAAAADPAGLTKRHTDAYANRGAAMFPIGDGMGAFSLNTSLAAAAVIDDHVTAWARQLRAHNPLLSLAAHRADAATRLLLGQHPLTGTSLLSTATGNPAAPPGTDSATAASPRECTPRDMEPPAVSDLSTWLPARTELRVTMTADTLLGLDDATCELNGYGPITAAQARQLALQSASVKLRRVFTDPADNSILFLDAHTYRFTRDQVECIATLHPYSTFPGATTPAAKCDIDHLNEYRAGSPNRGPRGRHESTTNSARAAPGQTVVSNGQPLGRRQHRLRTHGGWRVNRDPEDPHTFHWTSPRSRTYTTNDTDGA